MYRVRSTDVWFNAPGVVAAYQPIAAPGPLLARYNVGNDARMAGRHTATPGIAPTWSGAVGWTFNGTSNLTTDFMSTNGNCSYFLRLSSIDRSGTYYHFGNFAATGGNAAVGLLTSPAQTRFFNGWSLDTVITNTQGVFGISNRSAYLDGTLLAGTIPSYEGTATQKILIGAMNTLGPGKSNLQAFLVCRQGLTNANVALISRQMAYCHVNPDWSAWGRRRRYFYAPAQAGFLAAWAAHSNSQIGTGASL